jgi:serine/threonine-protein kinase
VLASLDHPHIVRVYDYVEGRCVRARDGAIAGGALADRLREERPSPASACAIAVAARYGLEHAHQRGVLHRDVTPRIRCLMSGGW